ncbi:MAG: cysteine--tRNA ligase [archaeon]|nr:cysteine--tRNA ligase [archaeon]
MTLKIGNTLTNKKEEFKPIVPGKVKMYVCGVTVYDDIHMGHARSIITFDVVRRYLMYKGYDVTFVTNFTDVDDKIINRANERGIDPLKLSADYIDKYFEDIEKLGVRKADIYPQASTSMPYIIDMVQTIIDKGFGYATPSGSVYFRVKKVDDYGILSNRTIEDMKSAGRVDLDPEKEDPMDFAIWKAAKPGECFWDSPWGQGRPGWHIECSAMINHYLGDTIDIHGGGNDLIFPHHENEIAQTRGACGCALCNYWMHNGMLETKGADGKVVKMSKSLKNFFKVDDVAAKFDKYTIRFNYLNTHYRSPLTYGEENMLESQAALKRLWNTFRELQAYIRDAPAEGSDAAEIVTATKEKFETAMDDDFNTRAAIEALFSMSTEVNKMLAGKAVSKSGAEVILAFIASVDNILGIYPEDKAGDNDEELSNAMALVIDLRKEVRAKKQYDLADMIRDRLKEVGYAIEDSSEGAKWKKI